MPLVLSQVDEVICALVNTLEGGTIKHLLHHGVKLCQIIKAGLTLATLLRAVCLEAIVADDLVAACAVLSIDCDEIAVCTSCPSEHSVGTRVQFLHLGLNLPN